MKCDALEEKCDEYHCPDHAKADFEKWVKDKSSKTALDAMKENPALKGSKIYWKLNDLQNQ